MIRPSPAAARPASRPGAASGRPGGAFLPFRMVYPRRKEQDLAKAAATLDGDE
jgi:hypothetical protein